MTSPQRAEEPRLALLRPKVATASPARAWKAVRELVLHPPPGGSVRQALELASQFAEIALPSTDKLLRLWAETEDPGGFAEVVLAPA
ncbi:hypothetical protein AB0B45_14030 [Nonomuraea sp. NPDC049152]|uniref:hypothetical protein n=1 Tax=Nonomuraea sp. NPDC049152 TaxID=3154350 RepID=UPI003401B34B